MKRWRGSYAGAATLLLILGGIGFTGCASAPQCPPEPDWMRSPEQEGYYVGVGSAHTGSQAEDRPVAEARARTDLATRISTTIYSELEVATSSSSGGEYSQQVEELVNQSVETNLQDIETVDTYYCPSSGYWVYMRLSRDKWEQIQEQRRQEVVTRVKGLLDKVLSTEESPFVDRIERLVRSYGLIAEVSFGEELNGSLLGERGNLSDIVLNAIRQHADSLRISLVRDTVELQIGEPLAVEGTLRSGLTSQSGPIKIVLKDKAGQKLAETTTDSRGQFLLQLPEGLSAPGDSTLLIRPEVDAFKALESQKLNSAYEELAVKVNMVPAGLLVELKNSEVERSVESEVKALFLNKDLPFEFSPQELPGGFNLKVDLFVEDFPKYIEGAPDMAQAWAVVSLEYKGRSIYSYESAAVKDGGINPTQAHSRVLSKLLKNLKSDEALFSNIKTAQEEI
ncbi:MAG: LPP20 family lipoprotein [Spirochaetia bacterium]|nr:LPP20 family lipoprotein [Spirochaetia bacterium]